MVVPLSGRLPAQLELADGTTLTLRELHPEDEPALRAWFATVSPSSRYHRFGSCADLSPTDWRHLTRIDQVDHIAILALCEGELVGVARMIRLCGEPDAAEVAFLIDDARQRRKIGTVLRDQLMLIARARGYRKLYAYVLPENVAIRRLLGSTIVDRGGLLELAV